MRILIKNGQIVDGTGRLPYEGDVLIREGVIEGVGNIKDNRGDKVLNAEGLVVCPGFIDVNNHSDSYWTLFDYPYQESLLTQGTTTIIGGNCGSSLAPLISEEAINSIQKYTDISKVQANWGSFGEFLNFLKAFGLGLNFGSLVGHTTLRRALAGNEMRPLRDDELQIMAGVLDTAMKEGALGLSSGLVYTHARVASAKEIETLAKVVKDNGGVYATHVRQEGEDLVNSVREALEVAEKTGVSLQISHLKACDRKSWPLQERVLTMIAEARDKGIEVNYDVYPYVEAGPVLYTLLPVWLTEGGKKALIARLKDSVQRERALQEMREDDFDFSKIWLASAHLGRALSRRNVGEIAANQGRTAEEVVLDLVLASDDKATTVVERMNPKNVEKAIAGAYSMVSSNGAGYAKEYQEKGDFVHPRCFGAMPKFIREYIFDKRTLTLEAGIEKITGEPAKKYGLIEERGTLEEGKRADVTVFDPKHIRGRATLENPFLYSRGIQHVLVDGVLALENGAILKKRAGKIISG